MTQCPHCQQSLDLEPVWGLVSLDRLGCPERPIAVRCPACLSPLRIVTLRSAMAVVGIYLASAMFAMVNARQSSHPLLAVVGIAPFIIAFIYTPNIARRFARLVPVKESDTVDFPIESFEEQLKLDGVENPPSDPPTHQDAAWKCVTCSETNPQGFDICWKCSSDAPTKLARRPEHGHQMAPGQPAHVPRPRGPGKD